MTLTPLLTEILNGATDVLDPLPARSVLVPGSAAVWDECCGGQVWVRLLRKTMAVDRSGCQSGWNVEIGVGIIRCVEVVNDDGTAPTAAEISADADQMLIDLEALQTYLVCQMPLLGGILTSVVQQWEPLGPQGGCAGGEWTVRLLIPLSHCGG